MIAQIHQCLKQSPFDFCGPELLQRKEMAAHFGASAKEYSCDQLKCTRALAGVAPRPKITEGPSYSEHTLE